MICLLSVVAKVNNWTPLTASTFATTRDGPPTVARREIKLASKSLFFFKLTSGTSALGRKIGIVYLVYNGHLLDPKIVAIVDRWLLFIGTLVK